MKKFLTLLLALCLILSACGESRQGGENVSPVQTPRINEWGTEIYINQPENTTPDIRALNIRIKGINTGSLISTVRQSDLAHWGLDLTLKRTEKIDDNNVNLALEITNRHRNSIELRLPAIINYRYSNIADTFKVYRGNISLYNDKLVVSTLKEVQAYDINTLQPVGNPLDFSFETGDYHIADTVMDEKGFISAYYLENCFVVAEFDSNGNFMQKQEYSGKEARRFYSPTDDTFTNYKVSVYNKVDIRPANSEHSYAAVYQCRHDGNYLKAFVGVKSNEMKSSEFTDGSCLLDNDYYKVEILPYYSEGTVTYFALFKDKITGISKLNGFTASQDTMFFFNPSETDVSIGENMNNAVISHPESGIEITFDLQGGLARFENNKFILKEDNCFATDHSGKYSLYYAGSTGGGDAYYKQVVLQENTTGKTKPIGTTGGMYGGGSEAGFFKNGEVYLLDYDGFRIFSTDVSRKGHYFKLGDKFPFGDNPEKGLELRYLLAARRDPGDKTFLAVYVDIVSVDNMQLNNDYGVNGAVKLKATYKIGYFNRKGELVKEYDTGINATSTHFGLAYVDMNLRDRYLVDIKVSRGYTVYEKGTLDLQTGVFTTT